MDAVDCGPVNGSGYCQAGHVCTKDHKCISEAQIERQKTEAQAARRRAEEEKKAAEEARQQQLRAQREAAARAVEEKREAERRRQQLAATEKVSDQLRQSLQKQQQAEQQELQKQKTKELQLLAGQQNCITKRLYELAYPGQSNPYSCEQLSKQGGPSGVSLDDKQLRDQVDYLKRNAVQQQPEQRKITASQVPASPAGGQQTFLCGTPRNQHPCPTIIGSAPPETAAKVPAPTRNPFSEPTPEEDAKSRAKQEVERNKEWGQMAKAAKLPQLCEKCNSWTIWRCDVGTGLPAYYGRADGKWCTTCDSKNDSCKSCKPLSYQARC